MENEIKVGEYVRSDLGSIGKVTRIENNVFLYEDKELICFIDNVVNHSKNIKDIIEIGDYINGVKVKCFFRDNLTHMVVIETVDKRKYYNDKIIHDIVTKEQFESIMYKVK